MHKGMTGRIGEEGPSSVKTIGDYVQQKYASDLQKPSSDLVPEKKLSFHEWYRENKDEISYNYEMASFIWKAGQENMP